MTEVRVEIRKGEADEVQIGEWRRLWMILLAECPEDCKANDGAPALIALAQEVGDE